MSKTDAGLPPDAAGSADNNATLGEVLPETGLSRKVDRSIQKIGSWVSWLWVVLMLVICLNVFMKNVLGQGSVRFEEIQWHIYSLVFLLGLSYTLTYDDHVRVDLLYDTFSARRKAQVELLGIVVFLLPFLTILLYYTVPFVVQAVMDGERSSSPAGLSHYWIIKSALIVGLVLLIAAALARLHRCIAFLRQGDAGVAQNGRKQQGGDDDGA